MKAVEFWALKLGNRFLAEIDFGGSTNLPQLFPTRKIARLRKVPWGKKAKAIKVKIVPVLPSAIKVSKLCFEDEFVFESFRDREK